MAIYITVDGGTSNTRLSLVADGEVRDTVRYQIGAGSGPDSHALIERAVLEGTDELLSRYGIALSEIDGVIASGMIGSESGLVSVAHISAPAGIDELADGIFETRIGTSDALKVAFIPGVKVDSCDFDLIDMMRGEETEIMGVRDVSANTLYILPGSHTKHILTDETRRIISSRTLLSGEMLSAIAGDTILKNSVSLGACQINYEFLEKGYAYSHAVGLGAALFKVRVLDKLLSCGSSDVYSFYLGAVMEGDVRTALSADAKRITVGGKRELRSPLAHLLRRYSDKTVVELDDSEALHAAAKGAVKIYERRKKRQSTKAI